MIRKSSYLLISALLATSAALAGNTSIINPTTVMLTLQDGMHAYIDFYGDNVFRLFCDPKDGPVRNPMSNPEAQILADSPRRHVGNLHLCGDTICTDRVKVLADGNDGRITVWRDGRMVVRQVLPVDFGRQSTTLTLAQAPGDYFYGGGVQNGRFSHRGEEIAIVNTNNWVDGGVASPTPFFWSTAGYGLMWHTFAPGRYDFWKAKEGETVLSHDTDYLDVFFMIDDGAVALLNDFYQLTGNPVLLPKFGFYEGHLNAYNRDYWTEAGDGKRGFMTYEDGKQYNESQKYNGGTRESLNGEHGNYQFSARAAIDRYLDNDMPLGWFLPNDGYGAGYGQTGTLEGNVQNLREFGEYARQKGVEIGLWTQSDLHPKEGVEALLQRDIVKEVRDAGVRVLKTDVAWVGAGYSFGLNGVADVAGIMPYYGGGARPFIISLDGWAGTQRYAGIWTGDQTGGEWEYIRFHIPTYIGSGLSGQPNISSDMDGIFGGRNIPVNVRDFQWKTFTPMQLNMDGWGSNPKYPQALGEPATSINRNYLKLKSALMPYTYTIAREAVDGKPMIRAMFLEEEGRDGFLLGKSTRYQFMYGPSLLVAPVYKDTEMQDGGDDIRNGIYLPRGLWMDVFDAKVYEGGRIINDFQAPLWKIPVFAKAGAIIPMTEAHLTPGQCRGDLIKLFVVPGKDNAFNLYDDDGTTDAYLRGEYATNLIETRSDGKSRLCVDIHPTKGWFRGLENSKEVVVCIPVHGGDCRLKAKVGGRKATARLDIAEETSPFAEYLKDNPCGIDVPKVRIARISIEGKVDLSRQGVSIEVDGIFTDTANPDLAKGGSLQAPAASVDSIGAYSLTTRWNAVDNADYYEILFEDKVYSTIRNLRHTIEELSPETGYDIKVRSVNRDGASPWTALSATTTADPLRNAVRDVTAETSCPSQGGQGIKHLFDFDEGSTWHTKWGEKAVPFQLTINLGSVNVLDRMLYLPRPDAGNGTITKGTYAYSMDGEDWTDCGDFLWDRNGKAKELAFTGQPTAQYVRLDVTEAVGDFGSGQQIYVFRQDGSEWYIPGDINLDGKLDENDLTSYLNYTGLRHGDGDFEGYVSKGDINGNGLIDVQDIATVATRLEGGVRLSDYVPASGQVTVRADKASCKAGDTVTLTIRGKDLKGINGISLCIPYDPTTLEYTGNTAATPAKEMYNMTRDRLHTNGQKALYPTLVNIGNGNVLDGDCELMQLTFKALRDADIKVNATDGIMVDKRNRAVTF